MKRYGIFLGIIVIGNLHAHEAVSDTATVTSDCTEQQEPELQKKSDKKTAMNTFKLIILRAIASFANIVRDPYNATNVALSITGMFSAAVEFTFEALKS